MILLASRSVVSGNSARGHYFRRARVELPGAATRSGRGARVELSGLESPVHRTSHIVNSMNQDVLHPTRLMARQA